MKQLRVHTTVENEACEERREYIYDSKRLTANVVMNDSGYIWAYFYDTDNTWTISLGDLTISQIKQNDMLKLLNAINEKTKEEINVTSDDNTRC